MTRPASASFLTLSPDAPQTGTSRLCLQWQAASSSKPVSVLLSQPERSPQILLHASLIPLWARLSPFHGHLSSFPITLSPDPAACV